jgi:hypothetical protein
MSAIFSSKGSKTTPMKTQTHLPKPAANQDRVTLDILERKFKVFAEADKEIAKHAGSSPGVEALMTEMLEVEHEPEFLAAVYCLDVLKWPIKRVRDTWESLTRQTGPDELAGRIKTQTHLPKPAANRRRVTLDILKRKFKVFAKADQEIAKHAVSSPGVEALMTHRLETDDDPRDMAVRYCLSVLKWPWERARQIANLD